MRFLIGVLLCIFAVFSVSAQQTWRQLPQKVVVDGNVVAKNALILSENTILISCDWLNNNAPSLTCFYDDFYESAYLTETAVPLEGRDASGCCANWQRTLTFRGDKLELGRSGSLFSSANIPLFEIGMVENEGSGVGVPKGEVAQNIKVIFKNKDAFVPLQVVAQQMKMSLQTSNNAVVVGTTAGFKRTLESIEKAEPWEARFASRYLKLSAPQRFLTETPKPIAEKGSDSLQNTLLLWQKGQVKQFIEIDGVFLTYWQLRDRTWMISYQAQLQKIPTWLCSPNSSKHGSVWQAIGVAVQERGQRPKLTGDFSKHASCHVKTKEYSHTQFFSSLQNNGLDVPKLWLALRILAPQLKTRLLKVEPPMVIDLKSGLLTASAVPKDYGFMQEKRLLGK